MDLDFTDEQEMLREMVRGICSTHASLDVVREMEDDPVGYPTELWKQFAAADLCGLLLPEQHGGSGMGALEGAIVFEEVGRSLAPSPLFATWLAAAAVHRSAPADLAAAWLPQVATGEAVLSVAQLEPGGSYGPKGVQATATADGDRWLLTGTKWHVPFASSATRVLVLARTGDAPDDVASFLVDPAAPGASLEQQFTIASDTRYALTLDSVPGERVGTWGDWHATLVEHLPLLAAQAVGGAQYALDITVQYAKDREQFDKPLGAFQAIAHYLADGATAVGGARLLTYEAAWSIPQGIRPVDRLAAMSKLFACQTFRDVTAVGEQVFGGVGFTLEYDIQLYFRRAKALQLSWADEPFLQELVAAATLD